MNCAFNERALLHIYALILKRIRDRDAGRYRRQPVYSCSDGKRREFHDTYLVPNLVEDYFIFYNENQDDMHPVKMAAHLHQRLVDIYLYYRWQRTHITVW